MLAYFAAASAVVSAPQILSAVAGVVRAINERGEQKPENPHADVEALVQMCEVMCKKSDNDSDILIVAKDLLASSGAELQTLVFHHIQCKKEYRMSWFKFVRRFDEEDHIQRIAAACEKVQGRLRLVDKYR